MRIDSLEKLEEAFNASPVLSDEYLYYNHIRTYKDTPLSQLILYPFDAHINNSQIYTLLLCYVPEPPHPYKNILNYLTDHYEEAKDRLPNFHLLREYCHTYIYQKLKYSDSEQHRDLTTKTPLLVRNTFGWEMYNRFLLSFVRLSEEVLGKFTYVPDENYLKKDVQVCTSIGKILPKIFGEERLWFTNKLSIQLLGSSTKLHVADTPEEVTRVYNNGPRSCMKGISFPVVGYDKPLNPCAVYSTENVGVLYGERGGSITGRAVINKETKQYARWYGDNAFKTAMSAAGYKQNEYALSGCTLRVLEHSDYNRSVILLPYIDGGRIRFKLQDDELKQAQRGPIIADSVRALWDIDAECHVEDGVRCDNCDGIVREEFTQDVDGQMWCQGCVDDSAIEVWTSRWSTTLVPNDYDFIEVNGHYFIDEEVAEEHGWRQDIEGDWQPESDVYLYGGEYYTEQQLEDNGLVINPRTGEVEDDTEDEAA